MRTDELIDASVWADQARRGERMTKYAMFYHPMWMPNNTWVWKFIPGVLVGFVGSLLLFSSRLRRGKSSAVRFAESPEAELCRQRRPRSANGARAARVRDTFSGPPVDIKLMLVVNGGLKKMKPGKMGAQCGHAAGMVMKKLMQNHPELLFRWERCGTKKICVSANSTEHLETLSEQAHQAKILVTPVFDAGKTQIEEGSLTVVAIGPAEATALQPITGPLKLMT